MGSRKDQLKPGRYVRWRKSLIHDVFAFRGSDGRIRTACGLTRNAYVVDAKFTDVFPLTANHCWNCRMASGDVKPQIPTEVKVVKP